MNIKKLSEKAIIPTRGSPDAAGFDLYTTEKYDLKPNERKAFKTDIILEIPEHYFGRISPRSGLAVKYGIDVLAGTIDADYRDEIKVVLVNLGQETVSLPIIKEGKETAIAQIIFQQFGVPSNGFVEVKEVSKTVRGTGGFGSTDIKKEIKKEDKPEVKSAILEQYNKHPVEVKEKYTDELKHSNKI